MGRSGDLEKEAASDLPLRLAYQLVRLCTWPIDDR